MITLEAKQVEFFSDRDERVFFEWIGSLPSVKSVHGSGISILIEIENLEEEDLRDIIAIFYRYKIDMSQLSQFRTSNNDDWFNNKSMFWYDLVFGSS